MKVLYISSPSFSDCDFPLIRSLQNKNVDVTYLILMAPYSLQSTLISIKRQISKTKIFTASLYPEIEKYADYFDLSKVYIANRTGSSKLSLSYWKDTWNLINFIRKGNYDVIHSSVYFKGVRKFLYKLGKFVTTFHDPFPHTGEGFDNLSTIYQNVANLSKGIILLNRSQKEDFCRRYFIDESKIYLNSLGIYDNILSYARDVAPIKNNILFFGRISPYKGIEFLCKAILHVRESIPDATLTIAGGGKMYFDFSKYEHCDFIELRNYYIDISEMAELISRCDITVCPYTDATQSGVIMTSYALGKPVVASNVGGLGEMVDNVKTGILVPPKDERALANAIISILSDRQILKGMSNNIENKYSNGPCSWDRIAENYIKIYDKIKLT